MRATESRKSYAALLNAFLTVVGSSVSIHARCTRPAAHAMEIKIARLQKCNYDMYDALVLSTINVANLCNKVLFWTPQSQARATFGGSAALGLAAAINDLLAASYVWNASSARVFTTLGGRATSFHLSIAAIVHAFLDIFRTGTWVGTLSRPSSPYAISLCGGSHNLLETTDHLSSN